MLHMWKYAISLCFTFVALFINAQNPENTTATPGGDVTLDSIATPKKYGLRVGIDAAGLMRTALDDNYTGLQAMADYRITNNWYAAGEIGTEQATQLNECVDATASGAFIKLGADYNFYDNWLDMDNMIYVGFRAGYANFSQELTRYDYYQDNNYFPIPSNETARAFDGLNAVWLEIQLGVKVEVLPNFFLSMNAQLKQTVSQGQPSAFNNLYIPGFGRTYDTTGIGVGYAYGISYRIPFFKK